MTAHRAISVALGLTLAAGFLTAVQSSPAGAAPLNDCASSDNGSPRLTDFDLSPTAVDVTGGPASVTLTAKASDMGGPGPATGVAAVRVVFTRFFDPLSSRAVALQLSGDLWTGSVRLARFSKGGRLRVDHLVITDDVGNRRFVSGARLGARGFVHVVTVTSTADTTKPVLRHLDVIPTSVDTRSRARRVVFTARATDAHTRVDFLYVAGAMRERSISGQGDGDFVLLEKVAGTAHQFRGSMRVRRWVGSGTWRMFAALVVDRSSNVKYYGPRALDALGVHRSILVRSRGDTGSPTAGVFPSNPSAVDIRTGDVTISLRVKGIDALSGVAKVRVDLQATPGEDTVATTTLHRVTGTPHSGIWRGKATVPRCAPLTTTLRLVVILSDRAGNRGSATDVLPVDALDHRPPGADLPSPDEFVIVKTNGPIAVHFNENVNGISNTSATLRHVNEDGTRGPAMVGGWTCTTKAGAATDCLTGRVRTASFTPEETLEFKNEYQVELNPEFTLDVTDLAGNPFRRARGSYYAID
jgi:hypothetical protein